MLHTLAQAAVTVTETVTNAPTAVPVEIVKQPQRGWETKDIVNLIFTLITSLIAILAVYQSGRNWRRDGPCAKTSIFLNGDAPENLVLYYRLHNIGRSPALVHLFMVVNKKTRTRRVVSARKFPLPEGPDGDYEQAKLKPGEVFGNTFTFDELENFRKDEWPNGKKASTQEAESFKDLRFETVVGNETVSAKIPRDIVKKLDAAIAQNET